MTERSQLRRHTAVPSRLCAGRWIIALTAALCCTGAETVVDRALNFRVTIPDGFEPGEKVGKDDLYLFFRMPADPSQTRTVIRITRLRGWLPPDLPLESFTQKGVQFELEPVTWKAYTLHRARAVMDVGGVRVVVLNVQVPLKPEAIAINVAGAESNEKELSSLLLGVLSSLDGESNWVSTPGGTTTEQDEKAKQAVARDLYVCLAIVAVVGVVIYVRRQRRRDKAGN
jgi:hypothetical protein